MQSAVLLLALVSVSSAYLYCFSDTNSLYSSYYNQYNAKEVRCYLGTNFCYMKTTNLTTGYLRNADCDNTGLSAYCTRSGCYTTVAGATICCCRYNDCNQPTTYYGNGAGVYSLVPLYLSAFSYILLK